MKILLSLDMSTTCTGWSTFDCETGKLIDYGTIKPSSKFNGQSLSKIGYPLQQLYKMIDLALKIRTLIENQKPTYIVIEEIAGSKQRLSQKVLDGLHWVVLYHIQEYIPIVEFYDVTGLDGWRTHLKLKLTDADKINNKESKKLNKDLGRGVPKLPEIGPKELACRYVNLRYGLTLNSLENQYDADIADSISMGSSWIQFKFPTKL